jgi:hypothetical protein
MKSTSIFGARYLLLFVDDFSRKMRVHILKYDAFLRFKVFKEAVENEAGRKIRVLQLENRGEFS